VEARGVAIVLAICAVAVALSANSSSAATKGLGHKFGKSNEQLKTVATALGSLRNPRKVHVKVITGPNFDVSVTFSVECFERKRKPRGSKFDDGAYTITGSATLPIPLPLKKAHKCVISAGGVLYQEGDPGPIRLQLFGTQRKPKQ
jgi:hypothetical protein